MEAVVEGCKLPVDGFVEQEVDVQLDVVWRAENTVSGATPPAGGAITSTHRTARLNCDT